MSHYIQVAYCDDSRPKYIPVEKEGYIFIETFRSIFSKATGMFFNFEGHQYVVKLYEGNFYPPVNGWGQRLYFPMFDDEDDYDNNEDDYDHEDDNNYNDHEDDDYYDDGDDYGNDDDPPQWKKVPQEDINKIIFEMMKGKSEGNDDEWDYKDDD